MNNIVENRPQTFDEWFLSLKKERRQILREDKWMLAQAAFTAGVQVGKKELAASDDKTTLEERFSIYVKRLIKEFGATEESLKGLVDLCADEIHFEEKTLDFSF